MSKDKTIKVLFVCHGNICRSPAAEGTFRHLVENRGLGNLFQIDSAGTASYHVGELPHSTTRAVARKRGIELNHKARQFSPSDFESFDYILTMDEYNHIDITRQIKKKEHEIKVLKFRTFDPLAKEKGNPPDVPDPYYGGNNGFDHVQDIMERTSEAFLDWLLKNKNLP